MDRFFLFVLFCNFLKVQINGDESQKWLYLCPWVGWLVTQNTTLWNEWLICWHDDVIKWKPFPRYWPFVRGIHRSPVNSRTKASDAELWCFFDRRLNERLSKQSWGWWFETLSRPLWRHRNGTSYCLILPHFGLWLLLWTWFNFNPSIDILKCEMKLLIHSQVSEWISNFIVHLTGHGTSYPCLD